LARLHIGIGAYFAFWLMLIGYAARSHWAPWPDLWIIFGAGIGVLIGLEFSRINILFFTRQKQAESSRVGIIYAADIFGSCLGALGASVFMIPAYGIYKTLVFMILVNIMMAAALF